MARQASGPPDRPLAQHTPPREEGAGGSRFVGGSQIGPYCLLEFLGRGAFGEVWLAERESTIARSRLAVKLPLNSGVDLEAIRQEAEVWVRVASHPNVLPLFEANVYDGQVVIVSEYAPDGSLKEWLVKHSGKAPSVDVAVSMVTGLLQGLQHLHARGVIHRDLKPANILMQGECPRIADFGLARFVDTLATAGSTGTPAYMAPEAFDGVRSIQTDLWAVGVIFYELLAGVRPFPQSELMSLLRAVSSSQPSALPSGTPPEVEWVIQRCLEKNPSGRYASVEALLSDLRDLSAPRSRDWAPTPAAPVGVDNLLHRLWDDLDADLQDALTLAYNQARREKKNRISTRTFFAALARLQPGRLPELLGQLPDGALPEPAAADLPTQSQILQDAPRLSRCVANALLQLGAAKPAWHKLAPEEVFVDIARYGTGPSVVKLRAHGVSPEWIDRSVRQLGWKVVRR